MIFTQSINNQRSTIDKVVEIENLSHFVELEDGRITAKNSGF
jgi:hypothetical protein